MKSVIVLVFFLLPGNKLMPSVSPLDSLLHRFPVSVEPTDELQTLRQKIKEYEETIEDWKDELAKAKKVRILSLIYVDATSPFYQVFVKRNLYYVQRMISKNRR